MGDEDEVALECSFCGRSRKEVKTLIQATDACICDGCVYLVSDTMSGDGPPIESSPASPRNEWERRHQELSALSFECARIIPELERLGCATATVEKAHALVRALDAARAERTE